MIRAIGLAAFLFSCFPSLSLAGARKPHIIIVYADDLGPGDIGCYGGKIAKTPHLDQMAKEGTRFLQYYSASPICSPSRCGLLTGMFPARWKITSYLQTRAGNRGCEQADFLDPLAPSLARILRALGYRTAHIGKWHLGGGRDVKDAPKFAAYGYDEHAGTWESPEPHPDTKVNLKGVMEENDRQIGRLFAGLKNLGVEKNTLVLFISDNGPLPTFEGTRTMGLRGCKLSLYDGGIRLPCIAHWPGRIPANRADDTSVLCAIDLTPTLAAIAGAKLPAGVTFDGEDRSKALFVTPMKDRLRPLFWEYGRNEKFFAYPKAADRSPNLAMRDGNWKFLINADGTSAELYDLSIDPKEAKNLATMHPDRTMRMRHTLLAWRKSLP